jgi:murein DD-endopeptidase MepM/ murein hydrolase activator NlpD
MPPKQELLFRKLHNLPTKAKWMGLTSLVLLSAAFAAYGVAPGTELEKSIGAARIVVETVKPQGLGGGTESAPMVGAVSEQVLAPALDASEASGASKSVAANGVTATAKSSVSPLANGISLPPRMDRFFQSERVRKGDTMATLLGRMGALDNDLLKFIAKNPVAQPFIKIQPGRMIQAEIGSDGKIHALHYVQPAVDDEDGEVTPGTRWTLARGDEGFIIRQEAAKLSTYTDTKVFSIRSTLAAAADASKVPESVANQIVDLFSDVIDFEKEARRGDRVKVIYQTVADASSLEAPVPGRVLAVEWLSGKRLYTALWFGDAKNPDSGEYYAFDGKSLQKSFLRYPIEFARISSEFSESRKHPIFKDWRAHKGVDFAAPLGTKVRATGDGVVEFIGVQRGYGNVITLQHGKYSTTYAHLNEFSPDLKEGAKIRQGDIIGFVGRTGYATGAHLHYEFKVAGEHADPLTADLPTRGPLDIANRKLLALRADQVKSLLAQLGASKLAQFQ